MRTLTLSLLFASFSLLASAQINSQWAEYKTSSDRAAAQTKEMKTKLNLNDSQVQKAYDINLKIADKFDILSQNFKTNNLEHQIAMNKLGSERDSLMEDILNRNQFLLYMDKRRIVAK